MSTDPLDELEAAWSAAIARGDILSAPKPFRFANEAHARITAEVIRALLGSIKAEILGEMERSVSDGKWHGMNRALAIIEKHERAGTPKDPPPR